MVGQQPVLMHLIRLLALVIIAATTSHAQDVAYCQAPHSLMGDAQGILLQATGSLPTGAVLFGQSKVEIFQQDYISFGAAGEFRLGLAFNPNQASQAFYPPGGADFPAGWERHILSSPGDSPLLLAVGPAEARLFSSTGNSPLSFPSQALGRLLATSSPRPNQAILLTLLPNSFFLLVHMFANSSHHKEISPMLPGGVLPGSAMRAARAADPCVFYIWQHKNLLRLTYSYDDNSVDVDRSLLNAVILDLVPTRLSSDTGPDSEDLLLLMEGGHWHVLRDGQLPVNGALGEGMPQPDFAPGQILAPFSHELVDGARTSIAFYRDDGIAGPKFWRLEFAPSGTLIRVRSVLFPTGATDLEALRPMFLRIDDSDAVRLVLANSRAYFDPVDFGCGDPANTLPGDESITCLSSSSSGWTCNTGRVPGIFGKGERLCNACRDGFGAFLNPNGAVACTACSTPNCATCDSSTGECLVCLTGYLVVISDQTFCLESCPTGFQPVGNVCQDASIGTRIQSDVSFTQATVSGTAWNPAGQDPVDVLLPTVLLVQAGAVYLPWSQDVRPPRLLGLRSSGLPLLITPMSTVAEENLQSVDAIAPGNWPSMGQSSLRGAIEILQPSSESGYHDAVVVYCSSAGLSFVWLKCLSVPVGPVGTPCKADLSLSSQNERPCDAIAAFADGRTIAVTDSTGTRLFRFSSGGSFSQVPLFGGPGLPVLLPGPSSAGDAQLMVLSDSHGNLTVSPLAMHLANDLRLSSVRMNVFARNKPAGLRPLVLPTPSRAGQSTGDFLASCLEADPNGMGTLWTVSHLPGGWAPRGQTAGLPSRSHTLLALADTPDDYRIEAVPLEGMPLTPGMLVLMVDRFFAMAILHCEPDRANCFFLPARKVTLPEELLLTAAAMFVAVPSPSSGITPPMGVAGQATSLGPSILTASFMVLLKDNVLPFRVDVTVALCPGAGPGIYLPDCLPCHDTCHTCFGSLPSQCIECHLAAPGHLPGVCLASCPAGLHQVPNTRTCDCHQDCDQCEADTSLNRFYCTDCAVGLALDVSDPLADRCLPCHDSCRACRFPDDEAACDGCALGFFEHGGLCLAACPPGTWANGVDRKCSACPDGCTACTGTDACSACSAGWYHDPDASKCHACPMTCDECTSPGVCSLCRPGLVFLSPNPSVGSLCGSTCAPGEYVGPGRCMACDGSCALCTGGPAVCSVCAPGHRWAGPAPAPGGTGACVACPPDCLSCSESICLSCTSGSFLSREGECVRHCPAGSYGDEQTDTCQPCDVTCAECAGPGGAECTACGPGLEMIQSGDQLYTCVSACPDGQYRPSVTAACLPCHSACATCNGPTDHDCWRCADSVLQDGQCLQSCAPKHVATSGRCLPCHPSCAGCFGTRSTECHDCLGGLLTLPAGGPAARCVAFCPVGYSTSTAGCSPCGAHCSSCPGQADTCALCERGWLLASPACVDSCPAGSSPQGGLCVTCHPTCDTCYGPGADQCTSCGSNHPLLVDGRCLADCPAGSFSSGHKCIPCHASCEACSGPGPEECASCPDGRVLLGSACLLACPAKHYVADAHPAGSVCRPCDASCAACDGPAEGQCTGCPAGAWLESGRCVDSCSARFFLCPGTSSCEACPAGCSSCAAADAGCMPVCTGCEGALVLSPVTGLCAEACAEGEFLPSGQTHCLACHASCRTCIDAGTFCTSCPGNSLWLQKETGICASACPGTGFVEAVFPGATPDRVCLACPDMCEACTTEGMAGACKLGPSGRVECPVPETCTRCALELLLHGGSCVPACPSTGFFADWEASPAECAACHDKCRVCSGPSRADCLDGPGSSRGRLALGLGLGLGLLLLLLLLVVLFFLRRRLGAASKRLPPTDDGLDENATVMNTILELSLPGSIMVNIGSDFARLNEASLGAGAQASVFGARAVGAGISDRLGCPGTVAIKQFKTHRLKPTQGPLFQNEIALMWLLRDMPGVVRLYGYSEQPPAIVMERFDTDLHNLLHSEVPLPPAILCAIVEQWTAGLEAMHAQGIAHRDIKSGNVFVSRNADGSWRAALGDLGASRSLSTDRSSALVVDVPELNAMTARYAAPEVLAAFQRRRPLDTELYLPADIYSAAVLLWECLHRRVPWQGQGFEEITAQVLAGGRPSAAGRGGVGPESHFEDLLQLAWDSNAHARPLAASLRQKATMARLATHGP